MITPEEVKLIIPFAPTDICDNISNYIKHLYIRKYNFMNDLDYELEILRILHRANANYDPKKGHITRYVKNTISLKMKDYLKRSYIDIVSIHESLSLEVAANIIEHDLQDYSDSTIQAVYNVITGKGTKRDRDIITEVFSKD